MTVQVRSGLSLSEKAYVEIKKGIISGQYSPGSDLQQITLSKELGLSRTPIREALSRLSQEGLVHLIPSKGAVVNQFSIEDMQDCFEARALLESSAAYSASNTISEKSSQQLIDFVEKQQKSLDKKDIAQVYKYDTEFHHTLLKNSRNKKILSLIQGLADESEVHRVRMLASQERMQKSIDEHRGIIEAILQKDPEQVRNLLFKHLNGFCHESIMEWLEREQR